MSAFVVVTVALIAGVLLRRTNVFPENTAQVLNLYVIWIALPALIIYQIPKLELSFAVVYPFAFAWGLLFVIAALVLFIGRVMRWSRSVICVLLLLTPLGNTSFVGIPLIQALLGDSAIPYAILYDQLGSFLALSLYGSFVLIWGTGAQFSWPNLLQKIVRFPPFIALLVGFAIRGIIIPDDLNLALHRFGDTLVPVVMLAVGFQWRFNLPKNYLAPLISGLTLKLLVMPALAWIVLSFLNIGELVRQTIILEAAMAPMISAGALAISQKQSPDLAAAMVGYGLLLGLCSVPLWAWWIG